MYSLPNLFLLFLEKKIINLNLINIYNKRIIFDLIPNNLEILLRPEYIKLIDKNTKLISIIRYNNQTNKLTYINNIDFFDKNKYSYNYSDIYSIDNI